MKNTPIHDNYNSDLLPLMPREASRIVEVGCSSGALARAFLKDSPSCEYIGIEVDPDFADVARNSCTKVLVGSIEQMQDATFDALFPSDCWVFGDVLEHLYDPWAVLQRIRLKLADTGCIIACIPNAQHWSLQARLNLGLFRYEDTGLLDRTHLRWFTRITVSELFHTTGFRIEELLGRMVDEPPQRAPTIAAIRDFAEALGASPDCAEDDATPFQWVIRAVPA